MSSCRNYVFIAVAAIASGACTGDFATEGARQVGTPDARSAAEPADAADVEVQPDPCLGVIAAGHRAISCDGMVFDVEVPDTCVQGGCGVIVDVHGGTMSAQMEDANTNMRALGREHGFIVIQPNANVEPPLASFAVEDDLRVLGLVERMLATWPVDSRRVHLTGFSQGGYMGWRFVCAHPEVDIFASIAPAAAAWGADCEANFLIVATGCLLDASSREIDLLYMHGADDGMVPISCSVEQRASLLRAYDMPALPTTVANDVNHNWVRYRNARGTVFEYIEHGYQAPNPLLRGHCYPGSHDAGDAPGQLFSFACAGTQAFSWGEVVIEFFLEHPKD